MELEEPLENPVFFKGFCICAFRSGEKKPPFHLGGHVVYFIQSMALPQAGAMAYKLIRFLMIYMRYVR